jgi:hypothetical protein
MVHRKRISPGAQFLYVLEGWVSRLARFVRAHGHSLGRETEWAEIRRRVGRTEGVFREEMHARPRVDP